MEIDYGSPGGDRPTGTEGDLQLSGSPGASPSQLVANHDLMLILQEVRRGGGVIRWHVCPDCMNLVEHEVRLTLDHRC